MAISRMRVTGAVLTAAAAAAAGVFAFGVAPTAGAEETAPLASRPPSSAKCVSTTGAIACWVQNGDNLWVKDTKKDGHYAVGVIATPIPWSSTLAGCTNRKGAGEWKFCDRALKDDGKNANLWVHRSNGDRYLNTDRRAVTT